MTARGFAGRDEHVTNLQGHLKLIGVNADITEEAETTDSNKKTFQSL